MEALALALRKRMVWTGREPIPLRKPKPKKPKDEIKKVIKHKRKAMGKIRKKVWDRGGDRRLEAKLEERSRETEELKRLLKPAGQASGPASTPETTINLIDIQTHVRTYQVTGSLNQDVSNLILDTICPVIEM